MLKEATLTTIHQLVDAEIDHCEMSLQMAFRDDTQDEVRCWTARLCNALSVRYELRLSTSLTNNAIGTVNTLIVDEIDRAGHVLQDVYDGRSVDDEAALDEWLTRLRTALLARRDFCDNY